MEYAMTIEDLRKRAEAVARECGTWPESERKCPPTTVRGLAAYVELIAVELDSIVVRYALAPPSSTKQGPVSTGYGDLRA